MPKKNKPKDNHKPRRLSRQINLQFEDKTAERFLGGQLSRAEKQYEAGRYDEALQILEPLAERYPDREKVLELLGISYASAGRLAEAREAFIRNLALGPDEAGPLARFNLAQLYALTGYPFLAYEQSLLIDCA